MWGKCPSPYFDSNSSESNIPCIFTVQYKGGLEIDGNTSFLDQFLEDQTNLLLLAWVHKSDF